MKVLQINCVYDYGSTGKITRDIHKNLQKNGFDSVVLYGRRQKVQEAGVYKTCTEFEAKAWNVLSRLTGQPYAVTPFGTLTLLHRLEREKPDVVHLQCINGYFVDIYRLLNYLKKNHIPTVLTLHAEFMYTGNCGYAFECNEWKTGCHNCPNQKEAINSTRKGAAAWNWKKMKEAFEGFDDLILCPVSNWVGERAAQSPVLRQYPICTVLNGIDTDVFHYREKEALVLREKLNVGDRKMILHVTASYTNPVKGGKFITELSQRLDSEKYVVVVVDGLNNPPPKEFCGIYYGRANGQEELAAFYSAADVMVLTSYRECLPTTCLESLCCGTEIVSFYFHGDEGEGSFPEKYVHFIPHGDMEQLTDTVKNVSEHHEEKKNCCEAGQKIFSQKVMVENYEKIYKKLLEQSTD